MKRRHFLQKTAAAGVCASLPFLARESRVLAAPTAVSAELAARREAVLADMEAKRQDTGMRILRADAQFFHLMAELLDTRKVLEIGTFHGYSSIWLATALEQTGGKLVTIEIDPERVKIAKHHLAEAGLADRVECLEGDAHQVAKTIEGPLDLVLLDADKDKNEDYFNTLYPRLRPGGVILLNHATEFKDLMKTYLDRVQHHPQLISLVLSVSMKDGISVTFKKR